MIFVDSHTHLHFDSFEADRDAVIQRARQAGVGAILTLGTDWASSRCTLEIAQRYDFIFAAAGIHPSEAQRARSEDLRRIQHLAQNHPKIVAIGEIGLDFYRNNGPPENQYRVFRDMLLIARELDLPVVIHSRAAIREIEWFLQEEGFTRLKGVMHCFEGDTLDARFFLDLGMYISFAGNITYKDFSRSQVVKSVPLERLLLETDSPFLPPEPYRGQRNEPAQVKAVARKIAEIHRVSLDAVAQMTTHNARTLFRLPGLEGI